MNKFWNFKKKQPEKQRDFIANNCEYNQKFQYAVNEIKTSRYTWYNFILKNLFEQFHRVVNVYFVILLILQFIPAISSLNPYTTLIPIVVVLAITAIKDAVDDFNRHKSDRTVNNRKVFLIKDGEAVEERWMNLKVGDVIKLTNNNHVAADLLLLSSSDEHNLVYIETAELDGETNLKVRQSLVQTGEMADDVNAFSSFAGAVKCEAPNNHLHKFTGNLIWNEETLPLDNEKILLRGCMIRNTDWCFGLVIFAGPDTKLMQNTGKTVLKRTSIERLTNKLVWLIFIFLLVLATVAGIGNSIWETQIGTHFQVYLPWDPIVSNPQLSGFLAFWSYIIVLNTVVPISLYVSIEFIRLGQSLFIDWDRKMYYDKKDLPAVARTTTLNEELGQIEYVFSDKTGTLTQNIMEFRKCSIGGRRFGNFVSDAKNDHANKSELRVDLSYNEYAEESFLFYDDSLVGDLRGGNQECCEFFRLISICHTVVSDETDDGVLSYQAQSPDEGALVKAARNFGFVFKSRSFDTITISELGELVEYKVLAILDFDNVRKRMSVIVEAPDGKITLYCKGADSVIYERLSTECPVNVKDKTNEHLGLFAGDGLRTLCLAVKHLDRDAYEVWHKAYHTASTALEDRDDRLSAVYEEIERDLILLGATAIEDKLQDGVPATIANLTKANIKIWVLTGDKLETAINIGYSCNMLTDEMKNVFVLQGYTLEEVEKNIADALKEINKETSSIPGHSRLNDNAQVEVTTAGVSNNNSCSVPSNSEDSYGLVINGRSLAYALEKSLEESFLKLASHCSAVICCRVTPLQKAQVVELVKKYKKAVTLAIGDGANDVSMIKAAHIGVGISGEEGTQAVLSADFAFGQFRFLERLLLVHGRWSYVRMCKFFGYFFYKNFAFTLVHFWFAFFNGLTAQSVYDDWFVTLYNIVYTSTPIFMLAIFDQDVNDEYSIRYPKLYLPGQKNELFNIKIFLISLIRGILVSLALFFVPYLVFVDGAGENGTDVSSLQTVSTVISTSLILVVTLQVAIETSFWTPLNHFFTWGSILVYFLFTFALHSNGLYQLLPSQFPFIGVARTSYRFSSLWLTVLFVTALCILPVLVIRLIRHSLYPTYANKILQKQIEEKRKRRGQSDTFTQRIRQKLNPKRRDSRPRSGYAFAQEQGFGRLMSAGRMGSKRRKKNAETPISVKKRVVEEKRTDL